MEIGENLKLRALLISGIFDKDMIKTVTYTEFLICGKYDEDLLRYRNGEISYYIENI